MADTIIATARRIAAGILITAAVGVGGLAVAGFALQPMNVADARQQQPQQQPQQPPTPQGSASAPGPIAAAMDEALISGSGAPRAQDAALSSSGQNSPADAEHYVIRGILDINEPLTHGDYAWTDEPIPGGPLLITVDLTAQTLSVFRGGYEIGVAVILYGADHKPTPTGEFTITQKKVDHISNLYNAPMPYMMRLTNDGVAIHGSEVEWGYATHGCVGVPTAFAKLLFEQVKLGDRVIVTDGSMMQIGDRVPVA